MKGGILQIDGEEVVEFSWTAGGGVICKGPHSSMSRTHSSWLFCHQRPSLSGGTSHDSFIVFQMCGYAPEQGLAIACPVLHC